MEKGRTIDICYEDLLNAIIIQAVSDLRRACKSLKLNKYDQDARIEIDSLMMFFYSDWFKQITDVEPDYILDRIKVEIRKWDPSDKSTNPFLSFKKRPRI